VVIYLERGANDLHMVQLVPPLPPSSLAPVKSRIVYLSGAGLPRLSWKKRPLKGCSSSSSCNQQGHMGSKTLLQQNPAVLNLGFG